MFLLFSMLSKDRHFKAMICAQESRHSLNYWLHKNGVTRTEFNAYVVVQIFLSV